MVQSGSFERGEELFDRLLRRCQFLADAPLAGRPRTERARMRSYPEPPYIIFYRPGRTHITIIRIVHEKQDLTTIFRPRKKR
jgi:plasmid stabilization system protein ParE